MTRDDTGDMKSKSVKSVRWTGRNDQRSQQNQTQASQAPSRPALRSPGQQSQPSQEDYFSFSGASGNVHAGESELNPPQQGQPPLRQPQPSQPQPSQPQPSQSQLSQSQQSRMQTGYIVDDESGSTGESSSESDSDDDEDDDDEHSANFRATTRANTWFNRLRQSDEDPEDAERDREPLQSSTRSTYSEGPTQYTSPQPPLPTIEVSQAAGNPFANVMDIGTKISGGLAPGGAELQPEDREDPLDDEYRERRNQLLASLGTHSQPTSPELPPIEVTREMDAIPLVRLDPGSPDKQEPLSHDAIEAQHLREQLESVQRQRGHEAEEAIAHRQALSSVHTRDSSGSSTEPLRPDEKSEGYYNPHPDPRHDDDHHHHRHHRHHSLKRHSTEGSTKSRSDEHESVKDDDNKSVDEEEQLKRLEEIARQEAEEHARQLVKSHLGANLLSSKAKNDGYVENANYLLDADLIDHEAEGRDEDHDETKRSEQDQERNNEASRQRRNDDSSSNSYDSGKMEKVDYDDKSHGHNDHGSEASSDSENEDEEENKRKVNLRGDPDYVPPPKRVKEGVLGSLLRLYAGQEDDTQSSHSGTPGGGSPSASLTPTPADTPIGSPQGTPLSTPTGEQPGPVASVAPVGAPSSSKKWKRPAYFRTQSSEDALGREAKGRPKWYKSKSSTHTPSLGQLAATGLAAASTAASNASHAGHDTLHHLRPASSGQLTPTGGLPSMQDFTSHFKAPKLGEDLSTLRDKEAKKKAKKAEQQKREQHKKLKKARLAEQARITVHIADVLQRQRFILRLCRALMLFGAPSHRLEEYLKITARVLEIDGQFLYMPGCMLISFGDATTHTSETKLVKVTQGLNLTKLDATHLIYKEVVHDLMGLEEASSHIDHLLRSKNMYAWYFVVIFYAMGCVCSGMYSFGAHWQDMPIIFLVGGGVGFLQYWAQPRSDLYSNVFEVSSSIIVSFVGRAFGSIGHDDNHRVFCFAAIVQGSLALILPGYIILTGALELQSRNLVAGSVRMFYANIYSLFLSFGITLGSAIYGWCDPHGASGETKCHRHIDDKWKILFVPMATLFMGMVNQAGPRQLPVMVAVGSGGYVVQYFVQKQVENASSFTSAIGAFTMGIMGNLYSRVGHGLAFAAMLPGIFTLVPSGLAAQGSLVAGVAVADAIVNKNSTNSTATNSTSAAATTTTMPADLSAASSSAAISQLGNSMTQVAVGITVGLFAATLVVYPLGLSKKRSGLFTF